MVGGWRGGCKGASRAMTSQRASPPQSLLAIIAVRFLTRHFTRGQRAAGLALEAIVRRTLLPSSSRSLRSLAGSVALALALLLVSEAGCGPEDDPKIENLNLAGTSSALTSTGPSQLVTFTCTGSPCPWGSSFNGHAVVWPASLVPTANRLGYSGSASIYLAAAHANGATITLTSGAATVYAGKPGGTSMHRVLRALSPGQPYEVAWIAPGEVVSVQGESSFSYEVTTLEPSDAGVPDAGVSGQLTASESATWQCTSSPCPWGGALTGNAIAWHASTDPLATRLGYSVSPALYLSAEHANGATVSIMSGTASIFAGPAGEVSHTLLATLSDGQSYTISGLASGDVVSVQNDNYPFSYIVQGLGGGDCEAVASTDPTCDGVDDDCSGQNDEDYVSVGTNCGTGACRVHGTTSCVHGVVSDSCTAGTPAAADTTCNGVDDDCNGSNDEDFVATPSSCGVGGCGRTGMVTCQGGVLVNSCAQGAPAANDATCNGSDDDCDGLADDDYVPSATACGLGVCASTGTVECLAGTTVDLCVPGSPQASDPCGGGDEDCDGLTDEDCCVPATCAGAEASCGLTGDGCGGVLDCGSCAAPETCGGGGVSNVCGVPNLPPPTSDVAPPLGDRTPTAYEALSFLFTGSNPIQQGVAEGAIQEHRIAALRGRVLSVQQQPVPGARISALRHPELGFTLSRADGSFDFAFNGGGTITLVVTRPGYLPVQRLVEEKWHGERVLSDVVLTRLSTVSTSVSADSSEPQIVLGEAIQDESGPRRPLLLVPPGFGPVAEIGGQSVPLSQLTIRGTEYTVGATGPNAMPGDLPPTSAYTYAIEMSVDEVGPTTPVRFAKPLPFYLENFIGMPDGTAVPVAHYDRDKAVWVPDADGIVVRMHSVTDGMANLVVDATGVPATTTLLSQIGIEDWERRILAERHVVGQTLWRVGLRHFSPADLNFGVMPPKPEDEPQPSPRMLQPQCPTTATGSIINCQGRTLAEEIPVGDTGLTLRYQSDRVGGGISDTKGVEIPIPQSTVPSTQWRVLEIFVGRRLAQRIPISAGMRSYRYTWDGRDADHRVWPGPIEISYRVRSQVDIPYLIEAWTGSSQSSFGSALCPSECNCGGGAGGVLPGMLLRPAGSSLVSPLRRVVVGESTVEAFGLDRWNLTNHHYFSPVTRTLYLGSGGKRKIDDDVADVEIHAGFGSDDFYAPTRESGDAYGADLNIISTVVGGADGSAYFQSLDNNGGASGAIWQVTPDNQLRRLRPDLDALQYVASDPAKRLLTTDTEGGLYISVGGNDRGGVYRLGVEDGARWTRVAGVPSVGEPGYGAFYPPWADGEPVMNRLLGGIYDVAVGTDGRLYLEVQTTNAPVRIIMVQPNGIGRVIYTSSSSPGPRNIELGPNSTLYVAESTGTGGKMITITPSGVVDRFAGGGTASSDDPSTPALEARLGPILDFTVTREGIVYLVEGINPYSRVRKIDKGVVSTVFLDRVPRAPGLTASTGPETQYGLAGWISALPDGRVVASEPRLRRLLAINSHFGNGQWYEDPASYETDYWHEERRCALVEPTNGGCLSWEVVRHYYERRHPTYLIQSEDGAEAYYFDEHGQHRLTIDRQTGKAKVRFRYTGEGEISEVELGYAGWVDYDSLRTQQRLLKVNRNKPRIRMQIEDLDHENSPLVTFPSDTEIQSNGLIWAADYQSNGLMERFWDPRGNRNGVRSGVPYTFAWGHLSRPNDSGPGQVVLLSDADPTGAVQTLASLPTQATYQPVYGRTWCGQPVLSSWTLVSQADTVTRTSGEQRLHRYETRATVRPDSDGLPMMERKATVTNPDQTSYSWTDTRPDGTSSASGPGWSRETQNPRLRSGQLPQKNHSFTETVGSLASDGSQTPQPRPALVRTESVEVTERQEDPLMPTTVRERTTRHRVTDGSTTTRNSSAHYDRRAGVTTYTSSAGRVSRVLTNEYGQVVEVQSPGQVPTILTYTGNQLKTVSRTRGGEHRETRLDYRDRWFPYPSTVTQAVSAAQSIVTSTDVRDFGFVRSARVNGQEAFAATPNESLLLASLTPPGRQAHGMAYSALGQLASYAPPGSVTTENPAQCPAGVQCFTYNRDRELTAVRLPDGSTVQYTYDLPGVRDGLLHGTNVPGWGQVSYSYLQGQLASATAPDGSAMSFAHQAYLPVRTSWTGVHTLRESFDSGPTVWSGALDGEVTQFYSGLLELQSFRVRNGFGFSVVRDADGLITQLTGVSGAAGVPNLVVARSPLDGHVTGTTHGVVSTTNQYDISSTDPGFGDLKGLSASAAGTLLFETSYAHDGLGRIRQLAETVQGQTRERVFSYDDMGRLTRVTDELGEQVARYDYDANGNRTLAVTSQGSVTPTCAGGSAANQHDQLCAYGDSSYVYDTNGALREKVGPDGTTTYSYDVAGHLQRVVLPNGDRIHYVHDALGRRIGKVLNGQLQKGWLYADSLRPVAQLNSAGQVESTFVYATRSNVPDFIVKKNGASNVTYRVIADHLGTPRLIVNAVTGAVVYSLELDEFGNLVSESGDATLLPHGFAGGLWDRDTGLVRFGARDYDPTTGRWTARDPILFAGADSNLYAYVGNDPINRVDSSGLAVHAFPIVVGGVAGAIGGLVSAFSDPNRTVTSVVQSTLVGAATGAGAVLGTSFFVTEFAGAGLVRGLNMLWGGIGGGAGAMTANAFAQGIFTGDVSNRQLALSGVGGSIGGVCGGALMNTVAGNTAGDVAMSLVQAPIDMLIGLFVGQDKGEP